MLRIWNGLGGFAWRGAVGLLVLAVLLGGVVAMPGAGGVDVLSPDSAEAANCPPTLSEGSEGQWIRELQYALNQYPYEVSGPWLDIDGDFGPKTEAAVEQFQGYYHLQKDGIVGPQTWGQLGYCF